MKKTVVNILKSCSDIEYKNFQSGLIPSVARDSIIGVRTPILRKIAKDIIKSDGADDFIADLPHKYFEENQLHAFILSEIQDFDVAIKKVSCFLPYIDNWATCDQMSPKVFVKNADKLLPYIEKWIKSKHVYTVRFGVLCLMRYFLDNNFNSKYADMVADIKSEEY